MARRRRRRNDDEYYDEEDVEVKRPRRRGRRLFVLVVLAVAAVVAGPTLVGISPLRNTLLGLSLPLDEWRVESSSGSFGWTSEQSIANLSITDPSGNPLLTAESIAVDRSLWTLATDASGPLKVTIIRPIFYVTTRADGSNIEDLLAELNAGSQNQAGGQSPAKSKRNVSIEVVEGTVRGFDAETERKWLLSDATVSTQLTEDSQLQINGGANLSISSEGEPGRVKFRLVQSDGLPRQLEVLSEQLPIEPLQPWLRRVLPESRMTGLISSDMNLNWAYDEQGSATIQTTGHVDASGVEIVAQVLGDDRLQFERLEAPWRLMIDEAGIVVEQLEAKSEWVSLSAQGAVSFDELRSLSLKQLPKQSTSVAGRVQLDRLAKMLPQTISLREGVRIDSGELEFSATGKPGAERFGWTAEARASKVAGTDGQRPIRWEDPIEVKLDLNDTDSGPQLNQLTLQAPFAQGKFATTNENIEGRFDFNLERLAARVGSVC